MLGGVGGDFFINLYLGYGLFDFHYVPERIRCFSQGGTTVNFLGFPCDSVWAGGGSSVGRVAQAETLSISPNPTQGLIYLDEATILRKYQYRIFDMQGRLLLSGERDGNSLQLPLAAGSYVLQLVHDGVLYVNRIVVSP